MPSANKSLRCSQTSPARRPCGCISNAIDLFEQGELEARVKQAREVLASLGKRVMPIA
jgi:hypothetical protein